MSVYILALRRENQSIASKSQIFPSTVVPGIEARLLGFCSKYLYLVGSATSPDHFMSAGESLLFYVGESRCCFFVYLGRISSYNFGVTGSGWCRHCNHHGSFIRFLWKDGCQSLWILFGKQNRSSQRWKYVGTRCDFKIFSLEKHPGFWCSIYRGRLTSAVSIPQNP